MFNRIQLQLIAFGVSAIASGASARQSPTPQPVGPQAGAPQVNREAMWPAPTAVDWARPCLIQWQRSYDDALAVARETHKPILVCINMDGEIASEHYAGVRYRQPEIARLYEPYVCVIASVYRHTARDYDEQGQRILCPRFGGVTCGEHIAIEPGLFAKFMDGKRIAPRHIGVEPGQGADPAQGPDASKQEIYDVYYAWDTDTIFNALRDGIANRTEVPITVVRNDRPLVERVESRDSGDRTAVERAYGKGDRGLRRVLLERALARGGEAPVDLLRLAVFGFDVELARLARRALAQSASESAIDLIAEAMRVPLDTTEREALVAALARLGAVYPRARTLAAVHQGLAARSSTIDVERWSDALARDAERAGDSTLDARDSVTGARGGATNARDDRRALQGRVDARARAVETRPVDPQALLALSESLLSLAADPRTERKYAGLLFEDARSDVNQAYTLGARGPRVEAVWTIADYSLGDVDAAYARVEQAIAGLPPDARDWNASALLEIFARARQQAIVKAVGEQSSWPAQWLSDVHAAYSVLARHPFGTDAQVVAHYDFLRWLGGSGPAARVLDEGLARFPDSAALHDRFRTRILAERGADGLESAYEELLGAPRPAPILESYAGYAALVAAEHHRRAGRAAQALAAYERGIAHYERALANDPEHRTNPDHFIALALAGRARVAYERKDDVRALDDLLASFARRPASAASRDGLNISPVDTAKMLRERLVEQERGTLVATLQAALDQLDPELLQLPAYEREAPSGTTSDGRSPRRSGQDAR